MPVTHQSSPGLCLPTAIFVPPKVQGWEIQNCLTLSVLNLTNT